MPPDRPHVLAATAQVQLLPALDVVAREENLTALGAHDGGNRGFLPVDENASEDQRAEGDDQKEQQ